VDRELTLHSLRHRRRTVAREIDMPEAVSRALMGHAPGERGARSVWQRAVVLAKRSEWIGRVDPLAGELGKP
jgi:hypothetical protein